MTRSRDEHVAWCKRRALAYVDAGELLNGTTSMLTDLDKHPETRIDPAGAMGTVSILGMMQAARGDVDGVRRWIEGFN